MFCGEIRFVIDVFPTECAGIEAVFVFVSGGGDNRTIKLGVFFDVDIKATFTGKDTGLTCLPIG